jgi:hypothetical protein
MERVNPSNKVPNETRREIVLVVSSNTDAHVIRSIVQKSHRNFRSRPAPIGKVCAHEDPIGLCVIYNVGAVRCAVCMAVVRVFLVPFAGLRVLEIYVVSESLLLASA